MSKKLPISIISFIAITALTGCIDTPNMDAPPFEVPWETVGEVDTNGSTGDTPSENNTGGLLNDLFGTGQQNTGGWFSNTGEDQQLWTGTYDPMLLEGEPRNDQVLMNQKHPFLEALTLPPNFNIDVYAEVPNARSMDVVTLANQTVTFVGTRQGSEVYAVIDYNNDFYADDVVTIADGLTQPNGVAFRNGDLYVAERSRILKFSNILQTLSNPTYDIVYDDLPDDAQHGRKYIAFWPDGLLYVPIGAPCNICDAGDPYATITTINLNTQERTIIARGIRNTVGFDRDPQTNSLRFTDNGRDQMGDDVPVDELNRLKQTPQHFGYPFCHQGTVQDPQFDSRPCSDFTAPIVNLWPHVAALGMEFYEGTQFPWSYDNDIFIAEHGSRNRSVATGYRVTMVDTAEQSYKTFISGRHNGSRVFWRPVDIEELPDGSLLISDDHAGLIYRVSYTQ